MEKKELLKQIDRQRERERDVNIGEFFANHLEMHPLYRKFDSIHEQRPSHHNNHFLFSSFDFFFTFFF
jgi:hypothetical protein